MAIVTVGVTTGASFVADVTVVGGTSLVEVGTTLICTVVLGAGVSLEEVFLHYRRRSGNYARYGIYE